MMLTRLVEIGDMQCASHEHFFLQENALFLSVGDLCLKISRVSVTCALKCKDGKCGLLFSKRYAYLMYRTTVVVSILKPGFSRRFNNNKSLKYLFYSLTATVNYCM